MKTLTSVTQLKLKQYTKIIRLKKIERCTKYSKLKQYTQENQKTNRRAEVRNITTLRCSKENTSTLSWKALNGHIQINVLKTVLWSLRQIETTSRDLYITFIRSRKIITWKHSRNLGNKKKMLMMENLERAYQYHQLSRR